MIFTKSGGSMGIGFAIPINMAKNIMEQLIYDGKVSRGWLGVSIGNLDKSMMEALGLKERGVLINDVFKGQPAEKAGIEGGDVILSVADSRTKSPNELRNAIASIRPGTTVPVEIIRRGDKIKFSITIESRDRSQTTISSSKSGNGLDIFTGLGIITRDTDNGLKINQIDRGKEAERRGLLVGDIIEEVKVSKNGPFIKIKSSKELKQATATVKKGGNIILRINRGGTLFYIAMRL
jgi:serine protease Do